MRPNGQPKIRFPWTETPVGGGFFIPTLTPDRLEREAKEAAARLKIRGRCYEGIFEGKYGLICERLR